MVFKRIFWEKGELKVPYTNIKGLVSALTILNDYLREKEPNFLRITETKLIGKTDLFNVGGGKYKPWTKSRYSKQGDLMLVVKKVY